MSTENEPNTTEQEITVYNCDLPQVRLNGQDQCLDFVVSHEGQSTEIPTLTRRQQWFNKQKKPFIVCHKKICPHCHFGSLGVRSIAVFEASNSELEN